MEENYQNLANAIVLSAVKDYRKALRVLSRNPKNRAVNYEINRIEKFFHSDYCKILTSIDAEFLINKLKAEVKEQEATV